MILANHGIVSSSGGELSFDTDALAFITAASITDNTQETAINKLVTDLKTANIWTKMKALYPFVGGTATSHTFNLKDPRNLNEAFRLIFFGGVTHSSNGVQFNGSTGFATTFFNPLVHFGSQYAHQSMYNRSDISTSLLIYGCNNSPNDNRFDFGFDVGRLPFHSVGNTAASAGVSISSTAGFITSSRTGASAGFMKKNATNIVNALPTFTSYASQNYFIGARNTGGAANYYSLGEMAFFSLGESLSDTEAADLYTAVQNYNTTLNRQV